MDARDGRLTIRKNNEEVLRKRLRLEAQQKCVDEIKSFGDCAKRSGLMVVFNCRKENVGMSDCMDRYYNEEEFQKFLIRENIDPSLIQKKK